MEYARVWQPLSEDRQLRFSRIYGYGMFEFDNTDDYDQRVWPL